MVGKLWVVLGCVVGCAADPTPAPDLETTASTALAASAMTDDPDLCGLAAALDAADECSLICDPDALRTRLIDEGFSGGRCYELRCTLSETITINAGVCL